MEYLGIMIPLLALSIPIIAIVSHSVTKVLRMHHEERMARGMMTDEDAERYDVTLAKLEARMKTLEAILDDEVPGWRRKYDD